MKITLSQCENIIGTPNTLGHYGGSYLWNLNPKFTVNGSFSVSDDVIKKRIFENTS